MQNLVALDPSRAGEQYARPMRLVVGIGDFALIRLLGAGSFAQVWLARKKTTGDVYAIKAIRKAKVHPHRLKRAPPSWRRVPVVAPPSSRGHLP